MIKHAKALIVTDISGFFWISQAFGVVFP